MNDLLIKRILTEKEAAKQQVSEKVEVMTKEISVDNFFKEPKSDDSTKQGLVTKEEYVSFISSMSEKEMRNYALFLQHITEGTRLEIPPFREKFEVNNKEYYKISFGSRKVRSRYNLVYAPFIEQLVIRYTFDLAKFNLSFDDLYLRAEEDTVNEAV